MFNKNFPFYNPNFTHRAAIQQLKSNTWRSDVDKASSEKFLFSTCLSGSDTEGNLKLNFFLLGDEGVVGAGVDIDLVVISLAIAMAVSKVFWSCAEIGLIVAWKIVSWNTLGISQEVFIANTDLLQIWSVFLYKTFVNSLLLRFVQQENIFE